MANRCKRFFYMFYGNYLFVMYLIVKIIYMLNVAGQLVLMNMFLDYDYHMYGFKVGINERMTLSTPSILYTEYMHYVMA